MEDPEFLTWEILLALHDRSLQRFGGLDGIRDEGALRSALAAAENVFYYGGGDLYAIAAAYTYHIAQSQGFLDGNKRTAVACASTFLIGGGCADSGGDQPIYDAMIAIADRRLDRAGLAMVLRGQFPLK